MKKILSPFVCIIATMLFFNVNAQVFDWAKQIDGEGWWNEGQANSIAIDSLGNIYTVGYFIGTMDFDPGEAVYNLSTSEWVVPQIMWPIRLPLHPTFPFMLQDISRVVLILILTWEVRYSPLWVQTTFLFRN